MLVFKAALVGDFFGGQGRFAQQGSGAGKAQFEQVLVWTEASMVGEFVAE